MIEFGRRRVVIAGAADGISAALVTQALLPAMRHLP